MNVICVQNALVVAVRSRDTWRIIIHSPKREIGLRQTKVRLANKLSHQLHSAQRILAAQCRARRGCRLPGPLLGEQGLTTDRWYGHSNH